MSFKFSLKFFPETISPLWEIVLYLYEKKNVIQYTLFKLHLLYLPYLLIFIKVLPPVKVKQWIIALVLPLDLLIEVITLNGK